MKAILHKSHIQDKKVLNDYLYFCTFVRLEIELNYDHLPLEC